MTVIRNKNLTRLKKEIALVKQSDFYNRNYYFSYLPRYKWLMKWLRIDPCLHFILFGGNRGYDPSPKFDSSWYLNNYLCENNINPLIHYLLVGKNKQNKTHSESGGLIEFLGLQGSGKTTLFYEANSIMNKVLGYKPGPTKLWTGMLEDKRMEAFGYFNFANFITTKDFDIFLKFIKDVISANEQYNFNIKTDPNIQKININYFIALCMYYQTIKNDFAKSWILFDDGFTNTLANYLGSKSSAIEEDLVNKIFDEMPKASLIFYVRTDINLCVQRLGKRKSGIPRHMRELSQNDLNSYLLWRENNLQKTVEVIKNTSTRVIFIDNNRPLSESKKIIKFEISKIF